jgi:hypothetical protein
MFSAENQPPPNRRKGSGIHGSTLVRRALQKAGKSEEMLIAHVVERAFDTEDKDSCQLLKELMARVTPPLKATVQPVQFDFPESGSHADKLDAILNAVAAGTLSADVAVMVSGIVKTSLEVREGTDLADRLARIEAILGAAE